MEARWLVEEVAGCELVGSSLNDLVTNRQMALYDNLVLRRLNGEPLQYVLGHWQFRDLDLMVDQRVLIPRPETETVVSHVLKEVDRHGGEVFVADLGTGSGAIGLSIALERSLTRVWCTDLSEEALLVTKANLAGLGQPAKRVTLCHGSWFNALPESLKGKLHIVASNAPYISTAEVLPPEVKDWEPSLALYGGESGTNHLEEVIKESISWLTPQGSLVLEMSPEQTELMAELATSAGFNEVLVLSDLADKPRSLVARKS
tara:strand:- start:1687 stop:2466 length:780 start_codon:yes stop_codon:yes gene_type:complete